MVFVPVVVRAALMAKLPPYRLTGPAMLVSLPMVMSAVFPALPSVSPLRLDRLLIVRPLREPVPTKFDPLPLQMKD